MAENGAKITFANLSELKTGHRLELPAVFGLILSPLAGVGHAGDKHSGHSDADMTMHQMHVMNRRCGNGAEGSNLVMLGQKNMAKGIDEISIQHGQKMRESADNLAS